MTPCIIIYTDRLPEHSNGCANAFVIRIRSDHRGDEGLKQHEATHVRQWWRTLGLHSLFYLCSKRYRLRAEVEAYREQLRYPHPTLSRDQQRDLYATWLSSPEPEGYGCHTICTKERALELLS